jgi:hypothetical protein
MHVFTSTLKLNKRKYETEKNYHLIPIKRES